MNNLRTTIKSACAAAAFLAVGTASAATVAWTDWTSLSAGLMSASGTMGGVGVTVSAANAMNGVSQLSGPGNCTNFWTQGADPAYTGGSVSNAPTACEQLGLNVANRITVNFSSAVSELYMGLLSVGQPGLAVTYSFDQAFTIDSEGDGYFGNDVTNGVLVGNNLTMREFHGVLRFAAPVSSVTFSTSAENWHAFTFGAGTVPEPTSLALVGAALLAASAAARRRQR